MTESQLKYMNKVKLISFIILTAGLLLVLVWSIMKNKTVEEPVEEEKTLAINYEIYGTSTKYDYSCATEDCVLSSQEGLFALEHKKAIPKIPERIGIVTASTGAAIKDILSTIKRRFPICETILFPSLVQGADAKDDIVRNIA